MAKNIKRLFALILAASMAMSLSVNAFATDGDDAIIEEMVEELPEIIEKEPANEPDAAPEIIGVAKIGDEGFDTLEDAIEAANQDTDTEESVVIELLEDVTFDRAFTIKRDITICGDFAIIRDENYTGTLFTVNAGASLLLEEVTIDGNNDWTFFEKDFLKDLKSGKTVSATDVTYYAYEEGAPVAANTLFVIKGSVVLDEGAAVQNHAGSRLFSVAKGGKLTFNTVTVDHNVSPASGVIAYVDAGGSWTIEDGAVMSNNYSHGANGSLSSTEGTMTMNGGEVFGNAGIGNGLFNRVYKTGVFTMNGGEIFENSIIKDPSNNWNGMVYIHNTGGTFIMNGGSIHDNLGSCCGGIGSKQLGTEANIQIHGGEIVDNKSINWIGADMCLGQPLQITDDSDVDEARLYDDLLISDRKTLTGDVYIYGWYAPMIAEGGTVDGNVTVCRGADSTLTDSSWINGLVTVDAIESLSVLRVKADAAIDGVQVRVLDSVADGDCTDAEEAAAVQSASYIEEKGADVDSPVLFFHRLTAAQKQNIVVTYDYNGGLDACGWSGTQVTTDGESYLPSEEELTRPTRDGYILAGWAYAEDNDPECLEMDTDGAYKGEAVTESLRLIAQWDRIVYTVNYQYIGNVPHDAPALPEVEEYAEGEDVEIADQPEMDGYVFYGWKDTSETLDEGVMPACNVILTGYWLEEDAEIEAPLGLKTDDEIEGLENAYEVKIEVPGNAEVQHDEVIIMMDGSYSGDDEWPAARAAILEIGKAVLDGTGHTKLTLMAFGMADNVVLEHIESLEELTKRLPEGGLPGGLLYGRSSTNCEVGFTGAAEYVISDEQLNEAYVIFISDGNVNTDETPRDFDTNWKTWTKFGDVFVAQAAFEETLSYGTKLPEAFKTVFGDRFDGASAEEIMTRAFGGEVTDEEFLAFADQVWADVYDYSDMIPGAKYPISDVEIAFVKYDKENGSYIQDLFYYTTYKSGYVTYPNRFARAAQAGTELASLVDKLYLIDVDNKSAWMDPATGDDSSKNVVGDNVSFTQITNFANFSEAFASALAELSVTGYKNVVVTDYMSKWVELDTDTVRVMNDSTGEIIWSAQDGWQIAEEARPTAQETPVIIEKVSPADYENGGEDVVGNESGDIYKLTWYVKDDALLRTDTYSLRYTVTVDTEETGFVPGRDYPANGTTTVSYEDEEEEEHEDEIEVPDVTVPGYTVTYMNGDDVLEQYTGLMTGDKIPGFEGKKPTAEDKKFDKWVLEEGTPDGKYIGTTDLVYIATFKGKPTVTPNNPDIEIPDEEVPLAEIPELFGDDHYAYIIGYPDGMVHPEGKITRAEVATIFFRLLDEEIRAALMTDVNNFSDVAKGQWYNHAVSTLSSIGVILGRNDGSFDPNAFITRAEFAAIAARFDPTGNPEGVFFTDIAGHWAEREIIIAANNGWVEGYNGQFRPNDYITRAEAMTLVNRVLHRLPETEHDLLEYMVIWPDNMDVNAWYYLAVQEATNSHDYVRKTEPVFETWTEFIEPYDWSLLEY